MKAKLINTIGLRTINGNTLEEFDDERMKIDLNSYANFIALKLSRC
ncbi:MAG: hypothetical protein J7502_08185 [Flavisolibacter sp.]|nr:hypothetical protein [Flavisolibacter sp.]